MHWFRVFVVIIFTSGFAAAQVWPWQEYCGNFFNPSGFPSPT